ncbi:uncharacterized protein LOC144804633 isoform X2 [Lissotriton helveticus]
MPNEIRSEPLKRMMVGMRFEVFLFVLLWATEASSQVSASFQSTETPDPGVTPEAVTLVLTPAVSTENLQTINATTPEPANVTEPPGTDVYTAGDILYPFGRSIDSMMFHADDSSTDLIPISGNFTLYGVTYHSLYVNTNGLLSFLMPVRIYDPHPFPEMAYSAVVAVYWADVDIRIAGEIYYRQSTDPDLLQNATSDIKTYFPSYDFTATWMFIATWDHVAYYNSPSPPRLVNTFQVVLISNGSLSFVLLNYGSIQWTKQYLEAGFQDVNPKQYYSLRERGNTGFPSFPNQTNVNVTGRYAFRVDTFCLPPDSCFFQVLYCNSSTCIHGYCTLNDTCHCDYGFKGPYCNEVASCNASTCIYGSCTSNDTCICYYGFQGPTCNEGIATTTSSSIPSTNTCFWYNCYNGYCFLGKCFCYNGFTGPTCNEVLATSSPPCNFYSCLNGYCSYGICVCYYGYTGPTCNQATSSAPCNSYSCLHGYCSYGKCVCYSGYTGPTCNQVSANSSSPCNAYNCKNGFCLLGKCICNAGYTGPPCNRASSTGLSTYLPWGLAILICYCYYGKDSSYIKKA